MDVTEKNRLRMEKQVRDANPVFNRDSKPATLDEFNKMLKKASKTTDGNQDVKAVLDKYDEIIKYAGDLRKGKGYFAQYSLNEEVPEKARIAANNAILSKLSNCIVQLKEAEKVVNSNKRLYK